MKKCLILNNNARWIWAKAEEINQYVDFRSEFYIHNTDRVRLIISVDSRYAVLVTAEYCADRRASIPRVLLKSFRYRCHIPLGMTQMGMTVGVSLDTCHPRIGVQLPKPDMNVSYSRDR